MNVEMMKKVVRRLRRIRHAKHFDMGFWGEKNECGTSACLAGHTVLAAGYTLVFPKDRGEVRTAFCRKGERGKRRFVSTTAEGLLGLSFSEGQRLFYLSQWPLEYRERVTLKNEKEHRVAADLLEAYINGTLVF